MSKTTILGFISIAFMTQSICSHNHAANPDTVADKVIIKDNVIVLKSKGESPREVTIKLPSVSGLKDNKALDKLKDILSLENTFGESLEEIQAEISEGDYGTQYVDFEVNYNQHNLLDINIFMESWGAHPNTFNAHRAINLKTGDVLTAGDVFNKPLLNKLVAKIKSLKKAEERDSLEDPHYSEEEMDTIIKGVEEAKDYDLNDLDDFSIGDKGLTFHYNYGTFPYVYKNLQPAGTYFISYKDLKPFIDPKGPLGVFVK